MSRGKLEMNQQSSKFHILLLVSLFLILIWSAINPHDYFTWFLEVFPALIGVAILAYTYRRFRFTNLVYVLVLLHCIVLIAGGKYTYALNPLFEYFKELFGWTRNNYDKLGHFMQGFTPALISRELFIRRRAVDGKGYTFFLSIAVPLAFAALYEIFEWLMAIVNGEKVESFLGTQGYFWDTQTDLFMCLVGSIIALLLLTKLHDRQIAEMDKN